MSETLQTPPTPEAPERGEQDRPQTAFIFVFVVLSVFVLIGVVLAVDQFFMVSVREEIDLKVNAAENPALRQLRADEQTRLTRYQWVDQRNGVLRIPLERARELVLAEWESRPQGFVAPAPEPAAAAPVPSPAAAPSLSPAPAPAPAAPAGQAEQTKDQPAEAPKGAPAAPGEKK